MPQPVRRRKIADWDEAEETGHDEPGWGIVSLGALAHGLPQLLLPQGGDQFANARACERAGVALVLSAEQLSPTSVGDAVRRLLTENSFTLAAKAVQTEIAAMPSPEQRLPALTA
jgi:UDP:flavonoid glycosyltransferase YjiC (YdhE family)